MGKSDSYYRKLLTLGLPIALQQLISTSLNMIDTVMISSQGDVAIAAVSIANKFLFVMIVTIFGLLSGMAIFFSQYYGVDDRKSIHKLTSLSVLLSVGLALIFTTAAIFFPKEIITLFIKDPHVIEQGGLYINIVAFSYIPMTITFALSTASRNVHRTVTPMVVSTISLCLNTFLNYLLINGNWGFPALGVKGAAYATLISRIVEIILIFIIIRLSKDNPIKLGFKEFFVFDVSMFKRTWPKVLPVVLNEASWVVGTTLYFVAFGKLGTSSVAAVQISNTVIELSWAIFMGIGGASAIQIGNAIGRNDNDTAYNMSKKAIRIGVSLAAVVCIIFILTRGFIVDIFNLDGETAQLAMLCILVMALSLPVRQLNYTTVVAVFRSGGDTKYCMFLDLSFVWIVGIPLTFIAVHFTNYGIPVILAVSYLEEFGKVPVNIWRFTSRKWINNLISDQ